MRKTSCLLPDCMPEYRETFKRNAIIYVCASVFVCRQSVILLSQGNSNLQESNGTVEQVVTWPGGSVQRAQFGVEGVHVLTGRVSRQV